MKEINLYQQTAGGRKQALYLLYRDQEGIFHE
jgi:hypothetical protein